MKNFVVSLMSLSVLLSLTACGDTGAKTVEYYSEHLDEAKARLEKCEKEGARGEEQYKDCSNANQAIKKQGKDN